MTKGFTPPTIENDPTYQQFHARTVPLGGRDAIDWTGCKLEAFVTSRRTPSEIRRKLGRTDGDAP